MASAIENLQVVTKDDRYIDGIKIHGIGIMEDCVAGSKVGKGTQHLNSSIFMSAMSQFIACNLSMLKGLIMDLEKHTNTLAATLSLPVETISSQINQIEFEILINQSNRIFMSAEMGGLKTNESLQEFLLAAWMAMMAAECDNFHSFTKYTAEERQKKNHMLRQKYIQAIPLTLKHNFIEPSRMDLIPRIALERLGIHNELCLVKWKNSGKATEWKEKGFKISERISSIKRHFDALHDDDQTEDHVAHLIWNFQAVYHVAILFHNTELDDLVDLIHIHNQHKKKQKEEEEENGEEEEGEEETTGTPCTTN